MRIVISDTYTGLDQIGTARQDFEPTHRVGKRIVVISAR